MTTRPTTTLDRLPVLTMSTSAAKATAYRRDSDHDMRCATSQIVAGDAYQQLVCLTDESIDSVICSPPYLGLRRYGPDEAELGQEATVDAYIARLLAVTAELHRVLAGHGTLFLNIGDTYSRSRTLGAPAKSLLLVPERLAIGLVEQGWLLRNVIIWHKTNGGLPTSVKDRFRNRHERVLFATKSSRYYFDLDRVRTPPRTPPGPARTVRPGKYSGRPAWAPPHAGSQDGLDRMHAAGRTCHPLGVNPGDVITTATAAFAGDHPAVYPAALIEPLLLAGTPERVCASCGRPWQRQRRTDRLGEIVSTCRCDAGWRRGRVCDPFCGSGTTGVVALKHGRDFLGIELSERYAAQAEQRIADTRGSPAA